MVDVARRWSEETPRGGLQNDTPRVGLERERLGKHPTQTTHHPRGSERMQGSPILEHDLLRPVLNRAGSADFDTEGFDSDSTDFVGERQGFR